MKLGTTLPTIATVILHACNLGNFPSNDQPLAEEHQCFCWPSPWHWYQNFVWQRSCPMQILQVLTAVSGCLASALNCKSSGPRFKSWTLQGEELGFVFFFSSQHLCKFVNAFQANTCANLSVSQCLPSQHLCKSVSVFQANICANLSMSSKSTLAQICQHLSSQHLCKSVSIFPPFCFFFCPTWSILYSGDFRQSCWCLHETADNKTMLKMLQKHSF